jgi:hypothetical protein
MPEFASHRTAGALATVLFGERGKLCKSLVIMLTTEEVPSVMAQFYLTEEDAQALATELETQSWQLVDAEPAQD